MKEYKFSRLVNLNTKNIATELIGYASGLNESIAFKELTGKELVVENLKHPSVRGIGKLNKVQKHSFSCDGEYINVEELYMVESYQKKKQNLSSKKFLSKDT